MASPLPHPCLFPDVFVLAVLFHANEKPWIHLAPPPLLKDLFVKEVQKTSLQVGGTDMGAGNSEEV